MIETEKYDVVNGRITAKTLMRSDNPLSLARQVSLFMIFSFWKRVYSYKLLDLHFFRLYGPLYMEIRDIR